MKLPLLDLEKNRKGDRTLPTQFQEEFRPDLIRRAVRALQAALRHTYGADPEAGNRSSSKTSKRRRDYRGTYGFGISRVNRKILSRRGTRMSWVGATTPQTRGGRRAHPPKAEKILSHSINIKERRKAIRSAMSATLNKELVVKRGHHCPAEYPFIMDSSFENLSKTPQVEKVLKALGFEEELERSAEKKVRAGLGKRRGRRYVRKKGLLLVVSGQCPLLKAARNISGVDVVSAKMLNAAYLAPGALAGRVTIWTEKALEVVEKENLFR